MRGAISGTLVLCFVLCVPGPSAQQLRVTDLLDRYVRGDFEAVVADLQKHSTFDWLLEQLQQDGLGWIEAGGPAARSRRELAAATLALEAARIGQWAEWKHRESFPDLSKTPFIPGMHDLGRTVSVPRLRFPESLYWHAPPRLIEWGCALLGADAESADAVERVWHLAALAVAQRSEDFEFLFSEGVRGLFNPDSEVDHLVHANVRFPLEPRFRLAEGIALEWRLPDRAIAVFERVQRDPDVGGEATMRMGATHFRRRNDDRALPLFDLTEARTRDPWVIYLARYFKGQLLERRKRSADAERAYRGALAAVPGSQSASVALAALLFRSDRRSEASALITSMLGRHPPATDPWRGYAHADDRFWAPLIARLRGEIRR